MSETTHIERFAVSARSESETKTSVRARDFEFVVDEPAALGGTDDGPNPVEYLVGAWAGCLNVVTHTVADEHGIEVDDVEIEIGGGLDPRKFLGEVDDVRAGYQELDVTVSVDADADEQALQELIEEVERRCPVGDNIANPTPTTVRIERQES